MRSGSTTPVEVWLDGQNEQRQYQTETLSLLPGEAQEIRPSFYALASLRTTYNPNGNLEIQAGAHTAYIAHAGQWTSHWDPGNQITLLGYLTRGEIRQMNRLNPNKRYYPLAVLHPLPALFERVRKWAEEQ